MPTASTCAARYSPGDVFSAGGVFLQLLSAGGGRGCLSLLFLGCLCMLSSIRGVGWVADSVAFRFFRRLRPFYPTEHALRWSKRVDVGARLALRHSLRVELSVRLNGASFSGLLWIGPVLVFPSCFACTERQGTKGLVCRFGGFFFHFATRVDTSVVVGSLSSLLA